MGKFVLDIDGMAQARGVRRLHRFLMDHGFTRYMSTQLAQGRLTQIDLKVLARLCEVFNCTVNDLLVFVPDSPEELERKPMFKSMVRQAAPVDVLARLQELDAEGLKRVQEVLRG